jgi:hypothetical protein
MKLIRILLFNIAIFWGIWVTLLTVSVVAHDLHAFLDDEVPNEWRASLPAYDDPEHAHAILKDQAAVPKQYRPYVAWRHKAFRSPTLNIDDAGMRVMDSHESGPTIGFFGGSAMWGEGVADDETIPAHFDGMTQGLAVKNYSEHGWVARQNLEQLINLVHLGEAPDIVIFYDGFNDVVIRCDQDLVTDINGHGGEHHMSEFAIGRRHTEFYSSFVKPFVRQIQEWLPGQDGNSEQDRYACAFSSERAGNTAASMIKTWDLARLIVESYGGRFYAFLQPTAHIGSPRIDYLPGDDMRELRNWEVRTRQFENVYAEYREALASRPWTGDLTDAFDNGQAVYTDTVHITSEGNRMIAARMLERLRTDGVIAATGPTGTEKQ